jgi:hypothetical protein
MKFQKVYSPQFYRLEYSDALPKDARTDLCHFQPSNTPKSDTTLHCKGSCIQRKSGVPYIC